MVNISHGVSVPNNGSKAMLLVRGIRPQASDCGFDLFLTDHWLKTGIMI